MLQGECLPRFEGLAHDGGVTQVNANFAPAQHSEIAGRRLWRRRIAAQKNDGRLGDLYQQFLTARWNGR